MYVLYEYVNISELSAVHIVKLDLLIFITFSFIY